MSISPFGGWYLVSSQLYFTINLEEIFYFNDKKYRIYAVFGVSQTPTICLNGKEILLKISEDRQKEVRRQLCEMAAGKAVIE